MGLRSLIKRLKARFGPSRVETRAVPRLALWEAEEGFDEEVINEAVESILHDLEESVDALNESFRGPN